MDQTVTPSIDSMQVIRDGNPQAIVGYAWQSATVLRVDFGAIPTSSGTIELLVADVNLRSVPGTMSKPPEFETFYP